MQRLQQMQVNLRAVVGDVRTEVRLHRSGCGNRTGQPRPVCRTESQASSLEQTAASMEQLASTVRQTADTAAKVSPRPKRAGSQVAASGGRASAGAGCRHARDAAVLGQDQ